MCQTTYACSAVHIREHHAVHKQNTLFNNELKTEMTTIIPLANRARSHIALTRPSWVSLASGERASGKRNPWVLESIVRDKIVSHMMTNNLFCDEQHGFVPGRSCVTQLLCVMEMWTNSLKSGEEIDCIYLDFQKAFDTVPHARLISKLKAYGMEGPLIKMDNKLSVKSHTKSCCQQ